MQFINMIVSAELCYMVCIIRRKGGRGDRFKRSSVLGESLPL